MKLDFEQLRKLSRQLHQNWTEDGDICEQLDKGAMVHSISFEPSTGICRAHVQWPYFRDLVANESDYPATYSRVQLSPQEEPWLHWTCSVLGVEIVTCMYKADVVKELAEAHLGCEDQSKLEAMDIEQLLTVWMDATEWNPSEKEVYI